MTTAAALDRFADEVGPVDAGPVSCVGGRTQWDVGGEPEVEGREVHARSGIVAYEPSEMTVRCGAGTTVAEVDEALAEQGQTVALPPFTAGSTVGGVLAVGRSGIRRLGYGPVRDAVLEARYVSAEGRLVKAGGPTVKNVSGFDLCRLLVGSLGTLGFLGEVVLRCRPLPSASRWFTGAGIDPFALRRRLHQAVSILWDGERTWLLLEGHPDDVREQAVAAGPGFEQVDGPPPLPSAGRLSLRPSQLRALEGTFVAEVGVGVVHVGSRVSWGASETPHDTRLFRPDLHRRIKEAFDPTGRMNPGRDVMRAVA